MVEPEGSKYAEFIAVELEREYKRRDAITVQASARLTAATTLASLLLTGIGALAAAHHKLRWFETLPVVITVLALTAAAFLGLRSGFSQKYRVPTADDLDDLRTNRWNEDSETAIWRLARANIMTLRTLRDGNATKAWWLHWSNYALLAAVVFSGIAIVLLAE